MLTVSFRCRICVRLDGASRVDCSLRAYISVCVFYKHRIERKVRTEGKMAVINCWVGLVVRWVLTAVKCCVDIWLCWNVDIWVCMECSDLCFHSDMTRTVKCVLLNDMLTFGYVQNAGIQVSMDCRQ